MSGRSSKFAKRKGYAILNVKQAKNIARTWVKHHELEGVIGFGLPEIDDRYHVWRIPLLGKSNNKRIGEVVIDAKTSLVVESKSTKREVLETRLLKRKGRKVKNARYNDLYKVSPVRNTIICGDAEDALQDLPAKSIDLVFTSPPYYNAKPECEDYIDYESYLLKMQKVIHEVHRVLNEGRFFVLNVSPILLRRASRYESSKRHAVPFDFHRLFIKEDFEFIDDIIWQKPEGAGWATGRGRRFAADRNPLQYKPVPVTEYVLVYRKRTPKLIDWNIRNYPDQDVIKRSKILGKYDKTNIWKISPAHHPKHPAVFPKELATKVIRYYSFISDVVLDPFAGIGTVGHAAFKLNRRFVLVDNEPKYVKVMLDEVLPIMGKKAKEVLFINKLEKPILFPSRLDMFTKDIE
jgi:DNA modification methylase